MNCQTIIDLVRSLTYNPSTVNPADTDIFNMINAAQSSIAGFLLTVQPDFFSEITGQVQYVNGQQEYALPTGLSKIVLVEVTDLGLPFKLAPRPFEERDRWSGPGEPDYFYWRNNGGTDYIGFLPTPYRSAVAPNVNITYVPDLPTVALYTDVPAIPSELHQALVYETCILVRERDQQPPQNFAALFDNELANYRAFAEGGRSAERRHVRWVQP